MNKTMLFLTSILILSLENQAFCFSFSPMNLTIAPEGKKATGVFNLENKSPDIIPIQISIEKRKIDIDGNEILSPLDATDKFIIYPPMVSLAPNEKRMVKVVYLGSKDIKDEKTFRLWATQLPVKNYEKDQDKSQVRFLSRYGASFYVAPAGAKPKVKLVEVLRSDEKTPKLLITFENNGNAHENLVQFNIKITGKDTSYTIGWEEIKSTFTSINIFPNQKRRVSIPWNPKFPSGPLTAELERLD